MFGSQWGAGDTRVVWKLNWAFNIIFIRNYKIVAVNIWKLKILKEISANDILTEVWIL